VCREEWCLEAVLDAVAGTLHALESGTRAELALCSVLLERFDAALVAVVLVDPDNSTATLTAWPHTVDMARMRLAVARLPADFPLLMHHLLLARRPSCLSRDAESPSWRAAIEWPFYEFMGCRDVAHLPLSGAAQQVCFALIARHNEFDHREMHILECTQTPLTALCAIATRAGEHAPAVGPDPGLTARELDVLGLVAEGLLARTIANRLDVSPRTVHKHLGSVYRKLDAHDRLVAVLRAETLGILPSPQQMSSSTTQEDGFLLRWQLYA